jgi:hypothetical protein
LATMQVIKQLSRGQSWLPDWMRESSAKLNCYQSGRLCVSGRMNEADIKISGRDLQEPVSSFYFGDGRGSMTRFTLLPSLTRCQVTAGHDGADGQDYYRCPCSALDNEGAGRSWAIKTPQMLSFTCEGLGCNENRQNKGKQTQNQKEAVRVVA